jgi:hypothetical protein
VHFQANLLNTRGSTTFCRGQTHSTNVLVVNYYKIFVKILNVKPNTRNYCRSVNITITTRAIKKGVPLRQHEPKSKHKIRKKNKKRQVSSEESESESEDEPVKKKKRTVDTGSSSEMEVHEGAKPGEEVEEVDVNADTDNEVSTSPIVLNGDSQK